MDSPIRIPHVDDDRGHSRTDGVGIPGDIREDVFDSGFTTAAENTGFGLAIVVQVAGAHGWEATVTDSRDGGSRFEFVDQPAGGTRVSATRAATNRRTGTHWPYMSKY